MLSHSYTTHILTYPFTDPLIHPAIHPLTPFPTPPLTPFPIPPLTSFPTFKGGVMLPGQNCQWLINPYGYTYPSADAQTGTYAGTSLGNLLLSEPF